MARFWILVITSLFAFSSTALGQCVGADEARIQAQEICGFKLWDNPPACNYKEAVIATEWVFFKDAGALETARNEFSACNYHKGYYSVRGAVLVAQRHNQAAMCNLLACHNDITAYYLTLIDSNRFPKFWDD